MPIRQGQQGPPGPLSGRRDSQALVRWRLAHRAPSLLLCLLSSVAAIPAALAQRQTAVGPGQIPLSVNGGLNGVDMSASGTTGTLLVGTLGGPVTDIYSTNNPFLSGLIAVSTATSSQGSISFLGGSSVFGAIGVAPPSGPFLNTIFAGAPNSTVNFLGPVSAVAVQITGTGTVNFNSGTSNAAAANFAADGTLGLAPNTTLIGALTTTAGAQTGTLNLGARSVLDGAVGGAVGLRSINVTGGDNNVGVSASISGAVNAYAFSLGTNTLNVGGALTIANGAPGGVINTTLASPTLFGNIRAVGATNLGPTLTVNVNVPSTAFIPVGTQFNIVQTQTGTVQSGTDGSVVGVTVQNPTNPLYTFAAVPPAGTVAGLVAIRVTGIPLQVPIAPPPGVPLPPTLPVAVVVAPVLISIAPPADVPAAAVTPAVATVAPTSDLAVNVLPALNAFSEPAKVVDAVAQLAPSASNIAAPLVGFQISRQFQGLWMSRLDNILCDQIRRPDTEKETCRVDERRSGWWMKGFVTTGNQGAKQAFGGYDSRTFGTMIAYDLAIDARTHAGIGLGYAGTGIDAKSLAGGSARTDFNTYKLAAYAGHERGAWFVYGDAAFGWNDYTSDRLIAFPGIRRTATAGYSGQDYGISATTGYHLNAAGFMVTPTAALQYTRLNVGSYTEQGAGDLNLAVKGQGYDFVESRLGVKVARPIVLPEVSLIPEVHVKWLHELANPTLSNTTAFVAANTQSFRSPGFKPAADTFNVGAGITLISCGACGPRTWSAEAVYNYDWRSDRFSGHEGMIRVTGRF